jgi:hypothetical protein
MTFHIIDWNTVHRPRTTAGEVTTLQKLPPRPLAPSLANRGRNNWLHGIFPFPFSFISGDYWENLVTFWELMQKASTSIHGKSSRILKIFDIIICIHSFFCRKSTHLRGGLFILTQLCQGPCSTQVDRVYHCKKVIDFPVPSREVTYQTLPWHGRECLVSDIPAGEGKTANLFYSVE